MWLFPKEGNVRKFKLLRDKGFIVSRKRNFSTVQGKDGCFYIATYGNGLFVYDPLADKLDHFSANDSRPIIASNYLINIHTDRDGNIWVGHEDAGLACLQKKSMPWTSHILPEPDMRGEKTNYITKLTPQKDGSLLVSTRSHKAYNYNPNTNLIIPAGTEPFDNVRVDSIKDDKGRTWILTSQADKRFKEKVIAIISQHIGDEDFNIDQMAEIMHMGRTKLYGKVKELTGMSPNKMLIAERMRTAAELLEEGELNISEISFKVGISDASYFNKCFKQHFGMAPSKYKKVK